MSTLSVLKFDTPEGAEQALSVVLDLQKQSLIEVVDAATVSWPAGAKAPKTKQLHSMTGAGALGGAFWGMLFGLIFFIPFFGLAVGLAIGALAGKFSDYGIDDKFIEATRSKITEGTSGLFALTQNAVTDRVIEALKGMKPEIISTNLSKEQEDKLRESFGGADEAAGGEAAAA
jgi:uncharacterized membrane protein